VTLAVLDLLHDLREVVARRRLPAETVLGAASAPPKPVARVEADSLFERVALDVLHPRPVELNERQQPAGRSIFWRSAAASSICSARSFFSFAFSSSSAFSA
jgi:hypothetical protein